ncbi:MAG TPA: PTS sugar transporter subunit IIA, partial [Woeseiaceae bacterium]|nr:PTS sugar transporter subunit IIA [Woeseiaceae bacterium]
GPHGSRTPLILPELIKPECVACNVQARSKKHCLEILSELLAGAEQEIPSEQVFARLVERERLGSTCLARGIAFPHCRVSGIHAEHAAVIKLATPIEFDAADGEMVDLVFGLMVPEIMNAEHQATIEQVAGILSDARVCAQLRASRTSDELYRRLQAARPGDGSALGSVRHG